jgi:hypothetical protein
MHVTPNSELPEAWRVCHLHLNRTPAHLEAAFAFKSESGLSFLHQSPRANADGFPSVQSP